MKSIYFFLLIVAMVACKKDNDPEITTEQILTDPVNGWVFTSVLITAGSQPTEAVGNPAFAQYFSDCRLDDATIFTLDGKFMIANNGKCDNTESEILSQGTWSLSSDKKTLTITQLGQNKTPTIYTIDVITSTSLKVETTFLSNPATITLKPKS